MTARVDFQARVPIGRVTINGQTFPVIATGEMIRALRTVQDSVNAVESGLTASEISFVPVGSISATDLQAAVAEVGSEKASAALLTAHTTNTSNPHSTTATQVGLGNVNNTSDANKPVSTAQAAADAAVQAYAIQRANHTGAQTAATISDFSTAADARITAAVGVSVQAYDADLTAWAGKTAPSGVAVGTTDAQTLANKTLTSPVINNPTGTMTLASGSLGYATGNGGTVTQITNKATAVTLDKPSGEITMHDANLADGLTIAFTLTNSTIAATDVLAMNVVSGATAGGYRLNAVCSAGSASIQVTNQSGGALAEAIVIRFVVIKGATS